MKNVTANVVNVEANLRNTAIADLVNKVNARKIPVTAIISKSTESNAAHGGPFIVNGDAHCSITSVADAESLCQAVDVLICYLNGYLDQFEGAVKSITLYVADPKGLLIGKHETIVMPAIQAIQNSQNAIMKLEATVADDECEKTKLLSEIDKALEQDYGKIGIHIDNGTCGESAFAFKAHVDHKTLKDNVNDLISKLTAYNAIRTAASSEFKGSAVEQIIATEPMWLSMPFVRTLTYGKFEDVIIEVSPRAILKAIRWHIVNDHTNGFIIPHGKLGGTIDSALEKYYDGKKVAENVADIDFSIGEVVSMYFAAVDVQVESNNDFKSFSDAKAILTSYYYDSLLPIAILSLFEAEPLIKELNRIPHAQLCRNTIVHTYRLFQNGRLNPATVANIRTRAALIKSVIAELAKR